LHGELISATRAVRTPDQISPETLTAVNPNLPAQRGYGFHDALIVAAALEAGCDTLLTEDLQEGRLISVLRIVNPFVASRR